MSRLWGGRFEGELDPFFEQFNQSLGFDCRMLEQDIQGSLAWTQALAGAGVLTAAEAKRLTRALKEIRSELRNADVFTIESDAEDVHSYVEEELGKRVGDLARKLHTGRSRNDQVATDLKLLLREEVRELYFRVTVLMQALVRLAERCADLPIPGYTHLQRAQPVTVGHHALAYVEMLDRDRERLQEAHRRMNTCPLGSGALAGSAFPIDRKTIARELGFDGGPTRNSLDAVSDRDHVCEVVFAGTMIMLHLSRLAEDYVFFASHEAGFLTFSDAVATGSSLMPQKKNPDAMELIRGKAGRVAGRLHGLTLTLKGLPLAYNKDLQEDKEALFDAVDTVGGCLRVAATAVDSVTFDADRCRQESARGHLNATDLADLLVQAGVPFRDAHERAGRAVQRALELGIELEELPAADRAKLVPELGADLGKKLGLASVLGRRKVIGGTAPVRVRAEMRTWKKKLKL